MCRISKKPHTKQNTNILRRIIAKNISVPSRSHHSFTCLLRDTLRPNCLVCPAGAFPTLVRNTGLVLVCSFSKLNPDIVLSLSSNRQNNMRQDTADVFHQPLRLRKYEVQLFYPLLRYNQVVLHHKHVSHALLYLDQ